MKRLRLTGREEHQLADNSRSRKPKRTDGHRVDLLDPAASAIYYIPRAQCWRLRPGRRVRLGPLMIEGEELVRPFSTILGLDAELRRDRVERKEVLQSDEHERAGSVIVVETRVRADVPRTEC